MSMAQNNQTNRRLTPFVRLGPKHQITLPKSIIKTLQLEVGDTFEPLTQNGSVILIPKRFVDQKKAPLKTPKQKTHKKKRNVVDDRDDWGLLALNALKKAYGENEPEYTSELIKETNPDYERR